MKSSILVAITLTILGLGSAMAQDVTGPEATDIIRSLAPVDEAQVGKPTPPASRRVVVQNTIIVVDLTHSLDFEIYFPFDSAEITPRARLELEALGKALASKELRRYSYVIAGHTDAKGSANYNDALSSRRAVAVRRYLFEQFALDPARLVAVGFGESLLKTPNAPHAGINRRVEVALILSRE